MRALAWLAAVVLLLAACGGSAKRPIRHRTRVLRPRVHVVDVYASLPWHGAAVTQSDAILDGIHLALEQSGGRAGDWTVHLESLDDATGAAGGWSAAQTGQDARLAAADPKAVYYIGELDSGATTYSIRILNEAGIPQVSPASGYVGLTTPPPGAPHAGEPQSFYPTGVRTFFRLAPSDSVQAAADLIAFKQAGCTRVAMAHDGSLDGVGLATLVERDKVPYGVDITSSTPFRLAVASLTAYASQVRSQGADCFFVAAASSSAAVQVTEAVNAALPRAKIFGSDGLCTGSWTSSRLGGVPSAVDPLIECTSPAGDLSASPAGRGFLAAFKSTYGISNPDPLAADGFEAMNLALDTIRALGPLGDSKADVLHALHATRRHSLIGDYGFDADGDTTATSYGLYRVGSGGVPVYYKTITPR